MAYWMRRVAAATLLLAIPVAITTAGPKASSAPEDGSVLNYPVGQHAWIGARGYELNNTDKAPAVVYDDIVSVANAGWLRLHFGQDTRLGEGSFIRVTSLRDGEVQELDAANYSQWKGTSAYFNGNSLRVEVIAGGLTRNAISVDTATWEPIHPDRVGGCGICGNDDRVPSSDNRFARLMPTGCSATMYNADSCFVTAGHCLSSGDVLQFNVPASSNNCNTNAPPVADQFPITGLDGVNGGVGDDYGAIKAGTNSEGQTPYERYGAFVNIGSVPSSGNLTVNGYGVDEECVRSQVQQFCEGPLEDTDSDTLYYDLDVTFGNSGSSILYNGEIVGVVTHCSESCLNYGTRIDKAAFVSTRDNVCAGGGGGGGDCLTGEIEDCNGNCCPAEWVGDSYCDDGAYTWNGVAIYLNCAEFNCDGGDCVCDEDPTGGCCVGTSCTVVTEAECGGDYLGDGTSCSNDPCGGSDPTGACCVGTSCSIVTEANCSGAWQGEGTDCSGTPCGGSGGDGDACGDAVAANEGSNAFDTSALSDSGYGDPNETQCEGTYLDWDGTADFWFVWTPGADGTAMFSTCDTNSYDTSMVLYEGTSCSNLSQIACNGDYADSSGCQDFHSQIDGVTISGGQSYYIRIGGWQGATGAGTLTIDADLGQPEQGACCINNQCSYVTEAACSSGNGTYQGNGVPCSPDPCAAPATGACCIADECYIKTEQECTSENGTYQGDDTNCDDDPCGSNSTGACCVNETTDWTCTDNTTQDWCKNVLGGVWHLGRSCNENPAPCPTGNDEIAIAWRVTGIDRTALDQSHYSVDVYLETPDAWRLDAVAGNNEQLKTIVSTSAFYQDNGGGPTSKDVNPDFYEFAPDLEWDSRVGIGSVDSSGNPYPINDLNQVGIDWTNFEGGGDLSADNGVWFLVPDDPAGASTSFISQDCSERNGVWIARLTTMDLSSEIMLDALFQGRTDGEVVWQEASGGTITYQGELDCNLNEVPDACDIANGTSEDANGNGIPDECDSGCTGDTDGDGDTDVDDILTIIKNFGNGYDVDDLLAVIEDFGCTG
jgi:V8-like Glu-specific endopeptidase